LNVVPDSTASVYQGRLIGSYRLRQRIGEGGMGEVYLAERENEFRKLVAIKLIRPGMASPEVVRRFLIERQTLAALSHPRIVRLVDGGTTEDGLPYLVVDYVDGGVPIDRFCDSHNLSVTKRLRLFLEVCAAVHHAHQSLIVHCDLKPSNILVTPEGSPMLLDFGIAKLLDPVSVGITANAAKTRQRAFTPDYASPEQLRGEPVTTAADVYALGVILYELLAGHSPYRANASASLADWIKSVCEEDAEPPSTVIRRVADIPAEDGSPPTRLTPESVSQSREGDPQKLQRRLRGDLDAIALKALRKEARDRYSSVDQLAEDIRRHLSGQPVLARKSTAPYLVRKFLQRHKLAVAAAALALAALTAGVASTLYEAHLAARRFDDVRQLAHTFLFDVHDSIQNLPGSTPARSLIARVGTEYLDGLARDSRGDSSLQLEVAEGYLKIGDVQGNPFGANLGNTAQSLENYRKALAIAESAAARNPKDYKAKQILGRIEVDLARVLPFDGKVAEGLDHAVRAVRLAREVLAASPDSIEAKLEVSHAFEAQGDVQGGANRTNLGRRKEAAESYRQSLAIIPQVPPGQVYTVRAARARAVLLMKIGDMKWMAHDLAPALADYQATLHAAHDLERADPNNVRTQDIISVVLNKIGSTHTTLGENDAAMDSFRQAIALDEAILRQDPNNDKARTGLMVSQKNLGDLLFFNIGKIPEALRSYRRVAELLETQSRSDPGNTVLRRNLSEVLTFVASALMQTGQPEEARRQAQRGLDIAKEIADRPGATQDQIYNYAYLGITVEPADLRRPAAVLPYALKAVEMSHGSDLYSLHALAQTYAAMDDYARAVQTDEKALALIPPVAPGKPEPNYKVTIENLLQRCRVELKKRGG
jgi:serine/threonine protein kinase